MTYDTQISETDTTQAIKDRVARYKSNRLTVAQRETMSSDICAAIVAAQPSTADEAVAWMTIVSGFIADVAPSTGGSLSDYLNEAAISRWVSTNANSGKSRKTLNTRRGVLNRTLRAHRGVAANITNGPARRRTAAPLSLIDVARLAKGCQDSCRSAWRGFVAHITAGVPIGTLGARFDSGAVNVLTAKSRQWLVAYQDNDLASLANLGGDHLIDADWGALKDVAAELGVVLTRDIVTQTYRLLAVSDNRFSIAERLTYFTLNERGATAVAQFLSPFASELANIDKIQLRDGLTNGVCTSGTTSALSNRANARGSEEDVAPLTRKTSRAAAKRLAAERSAEIAEKRRRALPVEDYLATFVPDRDDAIWNDIALTVRTAVGHCNFTSIQRAREHAVALAAYLRWRVAQGMAFEVTSSLIFAGIDVFYVQGMPDLSPRTRGDYRLRLRFIATAANASIDAPPALELGHNAVNRGYDLAEERSLRRWALMQSQTEVRRRLCAIVGLCAGAGLSSTELRALCRKDIFIDTDGTIVVSIKGQRPRQTVIRRTYEELVIIAISDLDPDDSVIPELKSSSPITAIIKGADQLGCTVALDTRRLRTTWICWLMRQHVSLQLAFEASGLQSARTFTDMLAYLPVAADLNELRDGGAK
ncbi:MAG TPA: hypothetical protein VMV53_11430 [Acidimicrobiales bacterium]|nr:hypothetical protein [Acidimicrobiales bacterium]